MIVCPLLQATERAGNACAILSAEQNLTYREFNAWVNLTVARLKEAGILAGDRVGLYCEMEWRYLVLFYAILRLGAIACPLNTRLPENSALEFSEEMGCRRVIRDPREFVTGGAIGPLKPLSEFSEDHPATLILTSGSTHRPKSVLHSFGNHYFSAQGSNENIPLKTEGRWLLSLPMFHVSGLGIFFRCLLAGATIVIPEKGEELHEIAKREQVTHLSLVSAQLHRLLENASTAELQSIQAILLGGSAFPRSLLEEGLTRGLPLHLSYGLSEMTSQVTTTFPGELKADRLHSGHLLPHRELRITPEGEIQVRGKTLFLGYWNQGVPTRPLTEDGWFSTRDLGEWTENHGLRVTGRRDNLFISGGENIQPEEIEGALFQLTGIEEAVVVPKEDLEFGFRPVAFIRSKLDHSVIREALTKKLPRYKIPVRFLPWPEDAPAGMKTDRKFFAKLVKTAHPLSS